MPVRDDRAAGVDDDKHRRQGVSTEEQVAGVAHDGGQRDEQANDNLAGTIRLVVRRRVARSDPAAGYGMIKVKPRRGRAGMRRLSDFDAAQLLKRKRAGA